MIKFKYEMPAGIDDFIIANVSDYMGGRYCIGYMQEGKVGSLNHNALYLMCTSEMDDEGNIKSKGPVVGMVARNEKEAVELYNDLNSCIGGNVLCLLEHSCDKLQVESM